LAARDNGDPVPVRVSINGNMIQTKSSTLKRGSVINGQHAGFMYGRQADMEKARAKAGEDADPFGIAIGVMALNRAKYE
jgi:hypothetical protein